MKKITFDVEAGVHVLSTCLMIFPVQQFMFCAVYFVAKIANTIPITDFAERIM